MSNTIQNDMSLENIDINGPIPAEETQRQFYFMAKASMHVKKLSEELCRKPTCCVTTFGCQMLSAT